MSFYGQNICVGVTGWLHYKEEAEYYNVPPLPTQVFGVGGKPDLGGGDIGVGYYSAGAYWAAHSRSIWNNYQGILECKLSEAVVLLLLMTCNSIITFGFIGCS